MTGGRQSVGTDRLGHLREKGLHEWPKAVRNLAYHRNWAYSDVAKARRDWKKRNQTLRPWTHSFLVISTALFWRGEDFEGF